MPEESLRKGGTIVGALIAMVLFSAAAIFLIPSPLLSRAVAIASAYLVLALAEIVPPFVPTLLLLVAIPLVLGPMDPKFSLAPVLGWGADPVVALFAGGLILSVAIRRHGLDGWIATRLIKASGDRRLRLLGLLLSGTAFLSMWMSNVAASALMVAAIRPILPEQPEAQSFRRALLLSVAVGANLGGITSPIGTGPNAIAIAAASSFRSVTFLHWMAFAVPLVIGMLALAFVLLALCYRIRGKTTLLARPRAALTVRAKAVAVVFAIAVIAWLAEPLHGIPAPVIALAIASILFLSRLLASGDLRDVDWSTLGLIAGGLILGDLLESSGALEPVGRVLASSPFPLSIQVALLMVACAALSSLMSNTASAVLLIPIAMTVAPAASTAVLVAIAASFGMPFIVSTPANALVYGEKGLRTKDFLIIGVPLFVVGCALVAFTGRSVLNAFGLP